MRYLFSIASLLLLLQCISVCLADGNAFSHSSSSHTHRNGHSKTSSIHNKGQNRFHVSHKSTYKEYEVRTPRVKILDVDLYDVTRYCEDIEDNGTKIKSIKGELMDCHKPLKDNEMKTNILTDEKRKFFMSWLLPQVVFDISRRTLVNVSNRKKFTITYDEDSICNGLNMSQINYDGEEWDADVLLYISAAPMHKKKDRNVSAFVHVCPMRVYNPIVVVLNLNPVIWTEKSEYSTKAENEVRKTFGLDSCELPNQSILDFKDENKSTKLVSLCISRDCKSNEIKYMDNENNWKQCTKKSLTRLPNVPSSITCQSLFRSCSEDKK